MMLMTPDHRTVADIQHAIRHYAPDNAPLDRLMDVVLPYHHQTGLFGLHASWTITQMIHETGWLTSPVSVNKHNMAGIKYGPHAPNPGDFRQYATDHGGVTDHVALLAVYTGTHVTGTVDDSRNDRLPGIIASHIDRTHVVMSYELSGIWATDPEYGHRIDRLWWRIFGWPTNTEGKP